jgi:hypothetical protein
MGKVSEFPALPALTATTKIPAAQRSALDDPEDLHFTPADIEAYLTTRGFLIIQETRYNDDAAAAAGGVAPGKPYIAGNAHVSATPNTLIFRSA